MSFTAVEKAVLKAVVSPGFIRKGKPRRVEVALGPDRRVWVEREVAKVLKEQHGGRIIEPKE